MEIRNIPPRISVRFNRSVCELSNVIADGTLLKQSITLASVEIASRTPLAMTNGGSFFPKEVRMRSGDTRND